MFQQRGESICSDSPGMFPTNKFLNANAFFLHIFRIKEAFEAINRCSVSSGISSLNQPSMILLSTVFLSPLELPLRSIIFALICSSFLSLIFSIQYFHRLGTFLVIFSFASLSFLFSFFFFFHQSALFCLNSKKARCVRRWEKWKKRKSLIILKAAFHEKKIRGSVVNNDFLSIESVEKRGKEKVSISLLSYRVLGWDCQK